MLYPLSYPGSTNPVYKHPGIPRADLWCCGEGGAGMPTGSGDVQGLCVAVCGGIQLLLARPL